MENSFVFLLYSLLCAKIKQNSGSIKHLFEIFIPFLVPITK